MQLEQDQFTKMSKSRTKSKRVLISLAQVGLQRNREPVQRTTEARAQEDTIVIHSEEVNGSADEEPSSVQLGGSIRRTRQNKTPSVEESD
jgi:hypothetical protein